MCFKRRGQKERSLLASFTDNSWTEFRRRKALPRSGREGNLGYREPCLCTSAMCGYMACFGNVYSLDTAAKVLGKWKEMPHSVTHGQNWPSPLPTHFNEKWEIWGGCNSSSYGVIAHLMQLMANSKFELTAPGCSLDLPALLPLPFQGLPSQDESQM